MADNILHRRLKALPRKPGVYLFKNGEDILYVGKASSLYNRVGSYFGSPENLTPKTRRMVARISDFDFFVTDSDQEAILLECNLIKRYRPRYNVRLKDDKNYPYLKVSFDEDWPRVFITRRPEKDGARYFGPFASAGSVRRTLNLLKRLFPFRSCRKPITENTSRPCLDYHIHHCLGPCTGTVSHEEYGQVIKQVVLFLEGKQETVLHQLRTKMEQEAENLEFEKAALLRDQIEDIEKIMERQKISSPEGEMDVIAMAREGDQVYVLVFYVRNGKLLGRENFVLTGAQDEDPSEIMTSFVQQFYNSAPFIPERILLQYPVEGMSLIQRWLGGRKGSKVVLKVPRRGTGKQMVDMVAENALQSLEQIRMKSLAESGALAHALKEMQVKLFMPRLPQRVECYDISNIQGTSAVGSMVVFENGLPRKSHYRRFSIKSVEGADDYAMLREVLRRRFKRVAGKSQGEDPWAIIPDLVLIDGGKGQLSAALEAMRESGVDTVSCASIAKEREAIFLPQLVEPVILPADSAALYLLQRVRDEAHRFALGYYHKVSHRKSMVSALDYIPGVGAERRKSLLRKFGSVKGVRQATLEELVAVKGMTRPVAEKIKKYL